MTQSKASQDARRNSLALVNPALARAWHPAKNKNLTAEDVSPFSSKKVWWQCSKGHEWEATISNRSSGKSCPFCSGRAVCEDNCLQTVNPALAREWHPAKNKDLTAKDVTANSGKKVWWQCSKGHEWESIVSNRSNGRGCPKCAHKHRHSDSE